ncbi:hypothetical protein MA16_Dca024064 [Dendrobium catenatum]|uniref:DUF4218 domain-containing protein n=1 Tax=Dendrobium catenatum TaxID=906689 RepID=A0A2I0VCK7_9ASPA|nr:hypothetical protein MA16_Dca024064 [Dendrobium catenatum]
MQCLLSTAFSYLPDQILKPLIKLSIFFKDLCSSKLNVENLIYLEKIFPPNFFDSMEHLPIQLPYETMVGGPVQYRWLYPFERYLNKLKKTAKNKSRP